MQKKQKDISRGFFKFFMLILPIILGSIGYGLNQDPDQKYFPDAIYSAFQMYFFNISAEIPTRSRLGVMLIEIGRWTAPVVSVGIGISVIVELVNGQLWPRLWSKIPGRYVVYGDEEEIQKLSIEADKIFSKYCVIKSKVYIGCRNYILLFDSDRKNLDFYATVLLPQIQDNDNITVYLNLHDMNCQDIQDRHLITFQVGEYIANKFFRNEEWVRYAYAMAQRPEPFKIALVGFGDLGKKIFESALMLNIVSSKQHVEYYVMGDTQKYASMHPQINDVTMCPDRVIFTGREWWEDLSLLETMDCLILCNDQETNISYLSDILRLTTVAGGSARVYVYVENEKLLNVMQIKHFAAKGKSDEEGFLIGGEKGRLFAFRLEEREKFLDRILEDRAYNDEVGRKKVRDYIDHYGKDNAKAGFDTYDWNNLNAYLRWDNVSSGYLDEIRSILQTIYGISVDSEESGRLEHLRWGRSHYLDNWKFGERNDRMKRHGSLVEYDELTDEEKEKDNNFQGA